MGKSTLFHEMYEYVLNSYNDVNATILSADNIRTYLINIEKERKKYYS